MGIDEIGTIWIRMAASALILCAISRGNGRSENQNVQSKKRKKFLAKENFIKAL